MLAPALLLCARLHLHPRGARHRRLVLRLRADLAGLGLRRRSATTPRPPPTRSSGWRCATTSSSSSARSCCRSASARVLAAILDRGHPERVAPSSAPSSSCRWSISAVAVALIWLIILDPNIGILNALVKSLGLTPPQPRLARRPRHLDLDGAGRRRLAVHRLHDGADPRRACRASRASSTRPPRSTARAG